MMGVFYADTDCDGRGVYYQNAGQIYCQDEREEGSDFLQEGDTDISFF